MSYEIQEIEKLYLPDSNYDLNKQYNGQGIDAYGQKNPAAGYVESCSISCGFDLVNGLDYYPIETLIQKIASRSKRKSFFVMSPTKSRGGGGRFVKYVQDNKLGEIIETPYILNRNHGPNKINVIVFQHDLEALLAHCKKMGWDVFGKE